MAMVERKEMTPVKTKNCASDEKSPGGLIITEVEPQLTFTASPSPRLEVNAFVIT